MPSRPKSGGFEKDLKRLEEIVERLEEEEGLSLEESIKLFEEGVKLAASCRKQLTQAENKVVKLIKTVQGLAEGPLEEE